jgi:5'-nucleotidase
MKNRFGAALAVVCAALSLYAACATPTKQQAKADAPAQAQGAQPASKKGRKLVVVGINDTHGALLSIPAPKWLSKSTTDEIGGADWFAGYINTIRAQAKAAGDDVVILDGGDLFQGTLISNQFQGRSVVDVYNQIGITAAAVGNHEFDFGMPVLKDRMAQAKFPILTANVFLKGTDTRPDWAKPYVIVEAAGAKVGIIGLSTVETPLTTNPANINEFEFRDSGPIASKLADELRRQGCTVVLITCHIGPLGDHEVQRLAAAVEGKVDGIVSGHHHKAIGPPPLIEHNIPIVQSGAKLTNFSLIELTLDAKGHTVSYAVNDGTKPSPGGPQPLLHTLDGLPMQWRGSTIVPDGAVAGILRDYDVQVKKLRDSVIGSLEVAMTKGGKDDLLANLCADSLRSGSGGGLKADFSFQNSGGIRVSEIPAGPVTFGQIFDLYPFDNQQVVVQLPANQVRNALEAVLRAGKGPLRVSGMRYKVDWEKYGAGQNFKNAPPGAIVTEVTNLNTGKPLCVTKSCTATECTSECATGTFTLSVTDFLANGGDGLTMLKDAPRQIGPVLSRDMIVAYVKENSPLTAAKLGSTAAGQPLRVITVGNTKSGQIVE